MVVGAALAVIFEERDLIAHFGDRYEDYRRRVPMFIPRWDTDASRLPQTPLITDTDSSPA